MGLEPTNPYSIKEHSTYLSDIAPVSSKEFFDIQAITECRFTQDSPKA